MFQKANKTSESTATSINLIGNGTTIIGDIKSNGDVRIDGTLKGNLSISGKLVVGPSGNIEGNIICQNADISGEIHGKVTVSELLSLKASAKVLGDIVTGKISIEPNATFTGTCNMGAVVKNITNVSEKREAATQTA
ncbi:MAG: polymer-forming cytoskeletal protein [Bacteroidetes bacterium]|jgi:cytoskeletal protein CcmA (bactofilin family)|nr:polymer-forming cytoskeletal protein [Bacteroidota bacterium]